MDAEDRMKKYTVLVALFVNVFISSSVLACKLGPDSSFNWSDERLVSSTPLILWVKVKSITPLEKSYDASQSDVRANYLFEIKKVIKGKFAKTTFKSDKFDVPHGAYKDQTLSHQNASYAGRSSYGTDCMLHESGHIGKSYLLFVDAFHPKFFEEVKTENDPWFKEVTSKIK